MAVEVGARSVPARLDADWVTRHADRTRMYGTAGSCRAGDLLARVQESTGSGRDALLHVLLTAASEGNADAARLVLQLLAPSACRVASRLRSLDGLSAEDRASVAVSAAWEAISTYPLHRTGQVSANLAGEVVHLLAASESANQRQIADRTDAVPPDVLAELAGAAPARVVPPEVRLVRVLAWATESRILTHEEADLLHRTTAGGERSARIAAILDVSPATVRKRIGRARWRLTAALREQHSPVEPAPRTVRPGRPVTGRDQTSVTCCDTCGV